MRRRQGEAHRDLLQCSNTQLLPSAHFKSDQKAEPGHSIGIKGAAAHVRNLQAAAEAKEGAGAARV